MNICRERCQFKEMKSPRGGHPRILVTDKLAEIIDTTSPIAGLPGCNLLRFQIRSMASFAASRQPWLFHWDRIHGIEVCSSYVIDRLTSPCVYFMLASESPAKDCPLSIPF